MKENNVGQCAEGSFFCKIDWAAFAVVTTLSFLVYCLTLGPSVTLEDCGELSVAADRLGIPHPPGYPLWTVCGYLFSRLFTWVTYLGFPAPARSLALMSAVFAALASGLTAMLVSRSAVDLFRLRTKEDGTADTVCRDRFSFVGGVAAGLCFAFSPVMWSQATIVEVYTLHAFLLMWIFLLTYRWVVRPSDKTLWLATFLLGLGLANYQVLLLAAVPFAVIILVRNIALFRDFLLLTIPMGLTGYALAIAPNLPHVRKAQAVMMPASVITALVLGSLLVLAGLALLIAWSRGGAGEAQPLPDPASKKRSHLRSLCASALIVLGGGAFLIPVATQGYAVYAGLAALLCVILACSALSSVWRNWIVLLLPWIGFLILLTWLIVLPGVPFKAHTFVNWFVPEVVFVTGVLALLLLAFKLPNGMAFAIPAISVQTAVFVLLCKGYLHGLTSPVTLWFWWAVVWNFVLIALGWLTLPRGKTVAVTALVTELGVSFYIYMPIASSFKPPLNSNCPRLWYGFVRTITRSQYSKLEPMSIVSMRFLEQFALYFRGLRIQFSAPLAALGLLPFSLWCLPHLCGGESRSRKTAIAVLVTGIVLALAACFSETLFPYLLPLAALVFGAGWLACYLLKGRDDDAMRSAHWLLSLLTGFIVLFILLLMLANVKGDMKDVFVQKVKFISAHGIYALWIGYGIILALYLAYRGLKLLPAKAAKALFAALALCALLTPAIPFAQNYLRRQIVFLLGGAEQNGHDFGWFFGRAAVDGAPGIRDSLSADEEPLPNPCYPPPMERGAVAYPGSDPGIFLLQYLSFSAKVRPDIAVISHRSISNIDMYLDSVRDHFGKELWLPELKDKNEEIAAWRAEDPEKRKHPIPFNELNGRFCRLIFERNNDTHAFYYEESLNFPWMKPYLVPNGIFFRLNKEKVWLTLRDEERDLEFWDWTSRRLLRNPAFRRDIPAQREFSNRRAAIAGLYSTLDRKGAAEVAFRQANLIYPACREATIRYVRDFLLRQMRCRESIRILTEFTHFDPYDMRIQQMLAKLTKEPEGNVQLALQYYYDVLTADNVPFEKIAELGAALYDMGQSKAACTIFDKSWEDVAGGERLTTAQTRKAAKAYSRAGFPAKALEILDRFTTVTPDEWPLWLDYALDAVERGAFNEASAALAGARRAGGKTADDWIRNDGRFARFTKKRAKGGM
ncbi:MAG: DUF2723 domain-containing protein [Kiritimatiellae bacterium]|nr:DUF2723 domain-containing protein [Kiritimatiellia bacterium]